MAPLLGNGSSFSLSFGKKENLRRVLDRHRERNSPKYVKLNFAFFAHFFLSEIVHLHRIFCHQFPISARIRVSDSSLRVRIANRVHFSNSAHDFSSVSDSSFSDFGVFLLWLFLTLKRPNFLSLFSNLRWWRGKIRWRETGSWQNQWLAFLQEKNGNKIVNSSSRNNDAKWQRRAS